MKKNYMLKQIFNKQVISHYRHLHTLNFNEIIDPELQAETGNKKIN